MPDGIEVITPTPGAAPAPPPATAPVAPAASATAPAPAPAADATAPAGSAFVTPWSNAQGMYTIGEGGSAKPWFEGIAEEPVREFMRAKGYANPNEAAIALHNANKLNKLEPYIAAVLEGKATPEQEAAFYNKLGRPDDPSKYDIKIDPSVPVHQPTLEFGKKLFHKLGANPAKAQEAVTEWNKFQAEQAAAQVEQMRVANEEAVKALEAKWGDQLNENKAAGLRALQSLKLSEELMASVESKIGDAALIELLAVIGRKSGEGTFVGGNTNTDPDDPGSMSQEQASKRASELRGDSVFMAKYNDKNHPEHAAAVAKMERLFARAK